MPVSTGILSIRRIGTVSNIFRGYSIFIDDKFIDKIKPDELKKYALPCGRHIIRVSLDFYKSKPLEIFVEERVNLCLECGDASPKTLGETLTLKGMGQSLTSLTSPSEYLYVKVIDQQGNVGKLTDRRRSSDNKFENNTGNMPHNDSGLTIFLSYRRDDSVGITGRICDRLMNHYGKSAVFRDVDSIPVGLDFRSKIQETIDKASVLIAIIGKSWLTASNAAGERRLDLPEDYVRLEIELALQKAIPVIPVLVAEAVMPQAHELPESISQLAYRNALFIPKEPYFHAGVDRLIAELEALALPRPNKIERTQKFCTKCGAKLNDHAKFCTGCGKPL